MAGRALGTAVIVLALLTTPLSAQAPGASKVPRVGVIGERSASDNFLAAFRQGLRDLGYVEGQNLLIEYRWTARGDRLPALMGELLSLQPDLIVT
jgi:putative ABC transport system substrate-binding protein